MTFVVNGPRATRVRRSQNTKSCARAGRAHCARERDRPSRGRVQCHVRAFILAYQFSRIRASGWGNISSVEFPVTGDFSRLGRLEFPVAERPELMSKLLTEPDILAEMAGEIRFNSRFDGNFAATSAGPPVWRRSTPPAWRWRNRQFILNSGHRARTRNGRIRIWRGRWLTCRTWSCW